MKQMVFNIVIIVLLILGAIELQVIQNDLRLQATLNASVVEALSNHADVLRVLVGDKGV